MNNNNVFRKSSLERVSSPEQLTDYIKVSRPSVWLILGAVILLLIGVCAWGIWGTITTTVDTVIVVQNGQPICYVYAEDAKNLALDMEVRVESSTGRITAIAASPVEIPENFDTYARYLSGLQPGDWMFPVMVDIALPDGTYMGKIVTEHITPITFVLN